MAVKTMENRMKKLLQTLQDRMHSKTIICWGSIESALKLIMLLNRF